jgi:uracil-DNA glycosylase
MPAEPIPPTIIDALERADPSWRPILMAGLETLERSTPGYLRRLATEHYLPTKQRLFAAFSLPLPAVRYVLVGEGPYPRADSATGVCFMDGAVGQLWCANGLSKPVNRATSLRNFMKMLLVADGKLEAGDTGAAALAAVAAKARGDGSIQTLAELQDNLTRHGFLLLNAALVFRPHVSPLQEARAWLPFLQTVLAALSELCPPPTLVLWGKVAEQLKRLPETSRFPQVCSEHPYNLSFITHTGMLELFRPMALLRAP